MNGWVDAAEPTRATCPTFVHLRVSRNSEETPPALVRVYPGTAWSPLACIPTESTHYIDVRGRPLLLWSGCTGIPPPPEP